MLSNSFTETRMDQINGEEMRDFNLDLILTRIHAGCFRITLSFGCQALLLKVLLQPRQNAKTTFPIPEFFYSTFLIVFWSISLLVLIFLSLLYALKCILHFEKVKAEFMHHIGVNYLFAPWISWLLVLESLPFAAKFENDVAFLVFWCIFAVPVVILDVKIYGQWFTKGKRFLTAVANPTSQLTVIGNLIASRAAARMEWHEVSLILFSLGIVHYLILFVTLYQRITDDDLLPSTLHPACSLFFATPSVASLAWYSINGSFDLASKMLFFLSLFLFISLMCRPIMFKKAMEQFNMEWWAYSYPITLLALTATRYDEANRGAVPHVMMFVLFGLSATVLFTLIIFSVFNPKLLLPSDDDPIVSVNLTLPITQSTSHTCNNTQ